MAFQNIQPAFHEWWSDNQTGLGNRGKYWIVAGRLDRNSSMPPEQALLTLFRILLSGNIFRCRIDGHQPTFKQHQQRFRYGSFGTGSSFNRVSSLTAKMIAVKSIGIQFFNQRIERFAPISSLDQITQYLAYRDFIPARLKVAHESHGALGISLSQFGQFTPCLNSTTPHAVLWMIPVMFVGQFLEEVKNIFVATLLHLFCTDRTIYPTHS